MRRRSRTKNYCLPRTPHMRSVAPFKNYHNFGLSETNLVLQLLKTFIVPLLMLVFVNVQIIVQCIVLHFIYKMNDVQNVQRIFMVSYTIINNCISFFLLSATFCLSELFHYLIEILLLLNNIANTYTVVM